MSVCSTMSHNLPRSLSVKPCTQGCDQVWLFFSVHRTFPFSLSCRAILAVLSLLPAALAARQYHQRVLSIYTLKQNTMKNGAFSSAMFMRVEEIPRKGNRDWSAVRKKVEIIECEKMLRRLLRL